MASWLVTFARRNNLVPQISATEREALDAGTVWIDGAFFSGKPDFARRLREPYPQLTAEEQAFLDGRSRKSAGWSTSGSWSAPDSFPRPSSRSCASTGSSA
jgi:hypothetical protein